MAVKRQWVIGGIAAIAVIAAGFLISVETVQQIPEPAPAPATTVDQPAETAVIVESSAAPVEAELAPSAQVAETATPAADAEDEPTTPKTGPGRVHGKVTLPANAPRGLRVTVELRSMKDFVNEKTLSPAFATTAADGDAYEFTNLPIDGYSVVATAPGFIGAQIAAPDQDDAADNVDIRLYPATTLAGRVVNQTGEPVAGALVLMANSSSGGRRDYAYEDFSMTLPTKSGADGRFKIASPNESDSNPRVKLLVRAKGYAATTTDYIAANATDISVVVKPGAAVSGMLVDASTNSPLAGKDVILVTENEMPMEPVHTDAEGFFFLADVPPGTQKLKLDDDEFVILAETASFTVVEGAPTDEVMLRAAKGGRISGRVYDQESGAGIEGVEVTAHVSNERFEDYATATTDASGAYTITGLAAEAYQLHHEQPEGYGRNYRDVTQRLIVANLGGEISGIDFALKRGLRISGRVVDEEGQPVADVSIHGSQMKGGAYDFVESHKDGTFELAGFEPGAAVDISGDKDGYAQIRVEPGDEIALATADKTDVKIVLGTESSISGLVVDSKGQPKPDVDMMASHVSGEPTAWATSESDGSIVFEGLTEGEYELSFDNEFVVMSRGGGNQEAKTQKVKVKKGERVAGVRIVAPETGPLSIAGRVEDLRGKPVPNAQIMVYGGAMDFRNEESNEKGEFSLHGLADGRYTLNVMHEGYSDAMNVQTSTGTKDLRVVLKDLATLEGQVLNASTGEPVKAFQIAPQHKMNLFGMAMAVPDMNGAVTIHDAEGRFSLKEVEDGVAELIVNAEGFSETKQAIPAVTGGETRRGVIVRLNAGATLVGRVTDSTGKPVAGARIDLVKGNAMFDFDMDAGPGATTAGDGTYKMSSLTPGTVKLSADHPDFPKTSVTATVAAGSESRRDIVMSNGGGLEGRVTLDGKPVPDQNVTIYTNLMSQEDFRDNDHATDASGRYRVAGLAEGIARVSVDISHDGYSRSQSLQARIKNGLVTQLDFNFVTGKSTIEGTIFERDGVRVTESMSLSVNMTGTNESFDAESDEDGNFIVEGVPAGAAIISVQREMNYKTVSVDVPEDARVRQDVVLGGGASVRVKIDMNGNVSMMTMAFLMRGNQDLSKITMDELETTPEFQPAAVAMVAGGEALLENLEEGTYTLYVMNMDPTNMEAENPFTSSSTVSRVIEVKQNQTQTVDIKF